MVHLKQTLPFNTLTLRIPCKQSNMVRSYVQFPKAASLYGNKITFFCECMIQSVCVHANLPTLG